jgi:type IV pilus assembly protein PilA
LHRWLNLFRRDRKGFTLIELIVVVIIIAVLAAIAVPLYIGHIKHARTSEGIARLGSIMTAAKTHYNRFNQWPSAAGEQGFYGDFSQSEHFTYSIQSGGGGTGAFTIQADGRDVDGMSGITITMTCSDAKAEGVVVTTGI